MARSNGAWVLVPLHTTPLVTEADISGREVLAGR